MFFGFYSLLVYQIQAIYITLFLVNRDMLTFYCCFTHLLSEIVSYLLKHILKQPRPDNGAPVGGLFEGRYGMPSQHCHCFAYLSTMVLLLVFHYYRQQIDINKKAFVLVVSTLCLILQISSRLYLRYHTVGQCLAGVALGTLSAVIFYLVGLYFFLPLSDQICAFKILRVLSFRKDLISEPPPTCQQQSLTRYKANQCRIKNS